MTFYSIFPYTQGCSFTSGVPFLVFIQTPNITRPAILPVAADHLLQPVQIKPVLVFVALPVEII
jgi:hypothetical protein